MADELIPDFQDSVKHIEEGTYGVVIATFLVEGIPYLDVRIDDNKDKQIIYGTPRANWEVVAQVDE